MQANLLRAGDYVLVANDDEPRGTVAQVVMAKPHTIGVRFPSGEERYLSSREGFGDILAAARWVEDHWAAL